MLKYLNIFVKPNPVDVRKKMLHEAELNLLQQQQARDYHAAMVNMLKARIAELSSDIARRA